LTNDHPDEYISINCVATGIGSGLSGINPATGNFDSGNSNNSTFYVSGGACPTCDNGKWLTDTSNPFGGFYTESECRVYYGCTGHSFLDPLETSFQEVCPSGVSGAEDLKLNEKLLISYGTWSYDYQLGWGEDELYYKDTEEKIQPGNGEDITHGTLHIENTTSQAEIFIDGYKSQYENFKFKKEWNKYKFFRIHNLNYYDIEFEFEPDESDEGVSLRGAESLGDGEFTLNDKTYIVSECGAGTGIKFNLKAGESRCIRRDFGIYTLGYNHFQKFKQGDAKYSFQLGLMGSTTQAYPTYSDPYVKSEESNWRDFTNNVNNPFLLRKYHETLLDNGYITLDKTWPRNWDSYYTYVETKNEEPDVISPIHTGILPWSRLSQPREYSFKDFNPYDPSTLIADLIYTTGHVLRSYVIRSGSVDQNPWAGTTAAWADPQLFEIGPTTEEIRYVYDLSLIPYSGARYFEEFLYNLGVNLAPAQPWDDNFLGYEKFRTPRSEYGSIPMMAWGWSGMWAGPQRMLAGEGLYYEGFRMGLIGCVPDSPGPDIGLDHLMDERQKSKSIHPIKKEYEFMNAVRGEGAILPNTYGWKLGYGGTWERFIKDVNYEGNLKHSTRVDGTEDFVVLHGERDKNPDNITMISGMRRDNFKNWFSASDAASVEGGAGFSGKWPTTGEYTGIAGDWRNFSPSTTDDPPDPFAYQIQVHPVSTNILGRDNSLNHTMQLYPLARPALDPPPLACNCHDQKLVSMIDTLYGHNISLGDYYWQPVVRKQKRRGDSWDIQPIAQSTWVGDNDQRLARMIFYDNQFYTTATAGFFNHYKLYPENQGPVSSYGGGNDFGGKCYPYFHSTDLYLGSYQAIVSGSRYEDDWHWNGPQSNSSPQCPAFFRNVHLVDIGADTFYLNKMTVDRPYDLIETVPFYKPVFYADPVPWRAFSSYRKWVGYYHNALLGAGHTHAFNPESIRHRCHTCDTSFLHNLGYFGNCVCGDDPAMISQYHTAAYGPAFEDEATFAHYSFMDLATGKDGDGRVTAPDGSLYPVSSFMSNYSPSNPDKHTSFGTKVPTDANRGHITPIHIDYLNESNRYANFQVIRNMAMPLHHKKNPDLKFDYDAAHNPNQLQHGRDNYRGLMQTNIYDLQEYLAEFSKIGGLWTGYRSYNDSAYADWSYEGLPNYVWSERVAGTKTNDGIYEIKPIVKVHRPGPHYERVLDYFGEGIIQPTGAAYGFDFSSVSGENFINSLQTFMDPETVVMSDADPFKYSSTDGGIGYGNVRFGDNQTVRYDVQKSVNLSRLNREPLYSFPSDAKGNNLNLSINRDTVFAEGMEIHPELKGYPDGSPILYNRSSTIIDKYYEYGCAYRSEAGLNRPPYGDNSYAIRGARSTLDGAELSVGGRNSLYSFQHANRVPEFYSALNPSSETIYNVGQFGNLMLAESGYKYLHPDVFSTEFLKENRFGKVRNRPIGGWDKINPFKKYIFGYPRAFEWLDNYSSQQESAVWTRKDILDQPVNYEIDRHLLYWGPPNGIYQFDEMVASPYGEGYWIECTGYYDKLMSGNATSEDIENFSGYCPHIQLKDFLGRTGEEIYLKPNPYLDETKYLKESFCRIYPKLEIQEGDTYAKVVGAHVRSMDGLDVGTGLFFNKPPKIDFKQPKFWPPANSSFTFTNADGEESRQITVDPNHESGRDANVYPVFHKYPDIPWYGSFSLSGVVSETTTDYGTYQQATDVMLENFIANRFGVRRFDNYPCYGDLWPSCPHDVATEL
jgi:hypothetical protein